MQNKEVTEGEVRANAKDASTQHARSKLWLTPGRLFMNKRV